MKNKILSILFIVILISFLFINNSVFAVSYDLSDYKNLPATNGVYVIAYSVDQDKIYYLTPLSTYYSNVFCYKHEDSTEDITYVFADWICFAGTTTNFSKVGGFYYYTFNPETNKFENQQQSGIHAESFNVGKCQIIASSVPIRQTNEDSIFFQVTPVPSMVIIGQEPVTTTLTPVLEKVEMVEPMMREILTLVPIMIILVVSYLGLRKGLAFIKTLRKM